MKKSDGRRFGRFFVVYITTSVFGSLSFSYSSDSWCIKSEMSKYNVCEFETCQTTGARAVLRQQNARNRELIKLINEGLR